MHILLIEDNPAEAHIFKGALKRIFGDDLSVRHCLTCAQAREYLTDHHDEVDLAFLDLCLPDSENWERSFETVEYYARQFPVIVMTGDGDETVARELLKRGAEDFIVKGSSKRNLDALKETIEFAICRHETVRNLARQADEEKMCVRWLTGGYSVE